MSNVKNNILIIGGPAVGKTHFGGQLYGRLNSRLFKLKIDPNNRPADITIFQEVINRLADGRRADHTEVGANRTVELKLLDEHGKRIAFTIPDYAGEQIDQIVNSRRINSVWRQYIENSSSWLLFVRLDEIMPMEDIINRGIPDAGEIQRRNIETPPVKMSAAATFIELLQMLLHTKGISTFAKVRKPHLTVVLSIWDALKVIEGTKPAEILKERLPMLFNFLRNCWDEQSLSIIGLSSTEKTLTDERDMEYVERSPLDFGYIVTPTGEKQKDLTQSIPRFLGSE